MALANVADIAARRGLKVLMVDFDLEAPGLEQFFQINQSGARGHSGLFDLFLSYKQSMSLVGASQKEPPFKELLNFILPVYEKLPGGGRLDLMPAGQRGDPAQLERYALNLRTFNWQDFYYNWEGELFFEWLRRSLVPDLYDVVLVDSRTGVTEMGGVCAYQLADAIAMFCAANHQNVRGTLNMVLDFNSDKVRAMRHGRALDLLIVPARVEQRDETLLQNFFERFNKAFSAFLPEPLARVNMSFADLMIPYEPEYAFEERVISDPSRASERKKIGGAFEKLAETIALLADKTSALNRLAPVPKEIIDAGVSPGTYAFAEAQYNVATRFDGYDLFIDYGREDRRVAEGLAKRMRDAGLQVFMDLSDLSAGPEHQAVLDEALFHSRALAVGIGAEEISPERQLWLRKAINAKVSEGRSRIVPVLLSGGTWESLAGTPLAELPGVDFRDGLDEREIAQLREAVSAGFSAAAAPQVEYGPPYVGLRVFDEADNPVFFGRTKLTESLTTRAASEAFLAVAGPSGCGKSSLVRAGMIPALRRSAAQGRQWRAIAIRPGPDPLASLSNGLSAHLPNRKPEQIAGALLADELELSRLGQEIIAPQGTIGASLLLFVDQFEEVFTLCGDEKARNAFIANLVALAKGSKGEAVVVLALRSDFIARCAEYPHLADLLHSHRFDMSPMNNEELRQAIEKPAERVGLAFEPGLVDRILNDMQDGPAALSLLQATLHNLWALRRNGWLTNAAYDQIEGVRGVLVRGAEDLYSRLTPDEQKAAKWVLMRLVQVGRGIETMRRRSIAHDLIPADAEGNETLAAPYRSAIIKLIEAQLLVASEENGQQTVEPVHEFLVRGWQRMRNWIEEGRELLEWRSQLQDHISDWNASGKGAATLLRGKALCEALQRARDRPADMSTQEIAFITNSEILSKRRRRKLTIIVSTVTTALIALIGIGVWQGISAQKAWRGEQIQKAAALFGQADDAASKGNTAEAIDLLGKVIDLNESLKDKNPAYAEPFRKRGILYDMVGNYDAAQKNFDRAIELNPENADAYLGRGVLLFHKGKGLEAIASFDKAAELMPLNAIIPLNRGLVLASLEEYARAIESYNEAIRLQPDMADAYFNRGIAYQKMERKKEAVADFNEVLRLPSASGQMVEAGRVRLHELGFDTSAILPARGPTRVALQYIDNNDLQIVEYLRERLQKRGFYVQIVPARAYTSGLVRYFFLQDEKRSMDVREIIESSLAERGLSLRLQPDYRDDKEYPTAKPGNIEVWLPPLQKQLLKLK